MSEKKKKVIEGIKLIYHNAGHVDEPDDPSYPFLADINLRPPEFMIVTFVGLYGGSELLKIRAKTREALDEFLEGNNLRKHPRLREMTITENGKVVQV